MERKVLFSKGRASHVEVMHDGRLAVTIQASADHLGTAVALKLTVTVFHHGRTITKLGPDVLRLETTDTECLDQYSLSINRQRVRVCFDKPSLPHEGGLIPKYMHIKIEQQ